MNKDAVPEGRASLVESFELALRYFAEWFTTIAFPPWTTTSSGVP